MSNGSKILVKLRGEFSTDEYKKMVALRFLSILIENRTILNRPKIYFYNHSNRGGAERIDDRLFEHYMRIMRIKCISVTIKEMARVEICFDDASLECICSATITITEAMIKVYRAHDFVQFINFYYEPKVINEV